MPCRSWATSFRTAAAPSSLLRLRSAPPLAKAYPPGAARRPLRSLLHQLAGCLMGDSLPTPLPSSRRRDSPSLLSPSRSSQARPRTSTSQTGTTRQPPTAGDPTQVARGLLSLHDALTYAWDFG